jgi:hypothetical protein
MFSCWIVSVGAITNLLFEFSADCLGNMIPKTLSLSTFENFVGCINILILDFLILT